ncbi:MAG TPA: asparagine synthase-related protein [Pseudolabrys sp.]|nr:asparagine synthase-related protein [Pseudolabrys sp.]
MTKGTFIGVADLAGRTIDPRYEDQMRRSCAGAPPARNSSRRVAGALFAHGQGDAIFSTRDGRGLFVACARLDNRGEIAEALGLPGAELARFSDEELLLRMFERRSGDGVARCLGAFAFAHWDADERRLTLGRDCLGHHTLLFHRAGERIIFSNRLRALLAMPDVPREIDELGLADLLALNQHGVRNTAYRGIERTPARSLLTFDPAGARRRYYWTPDFNAPPPYRRDEDYVARARELFDRAVKDAAAGADDIAISASGGLDSSAIAATLARLGGSRRITCYTLLPRADADVPVGTVMYRDERSKVEALARMYPSLEVEFLTRDTLHPYDEDPARFFAHALLPRMGGMAPGGAGFMIDHMRRHPLVLYGIFGNLGLSWPGDFALLDLLRRGRWARFTRELPRFARHRRQSIADTLISNVVKPAMPPGLRRLVRRMRGQDPDNIAAWSALNPDFIARHDLPRRWREQGQSALFDIEARDLARWRTWALFDRVGADRDNLDWVEQLHGNEVRDPHADRRLLEFALAVPEHVYCRDGVPRSFARAVFADRLPREIVAEVRRGSNNLEWFRFLDMKKPMIAREIERIEASATARRLIDIPRLKRLLDEWPQDAKAAHRRRLEYNAVLARGVHVGNFVRWVEGSNE